MLNMTPHAIANLHSLQLGQVVDNVDPDDRGRIKVFIHSVEMELWASVVTASAGTGYGMAFIPRIDEIVVLAFVSPELPLVLGSIWSGSGSVPDDADAHEDHYVIKTPAGTVMEFDDVDGPKVEIRTSQGHHITITDGNGGEIEIVRGEQSVKLTSSDITINATGPVNINGGSVSISAASVTVDAGISKFSGVVQADTIITNAVVSSSYTPGAGNIW